MRCMSNTIILGKGQIKVNKLQLAEIEEIETIDAELEKSKVIVIGSVANE